MANVLKSYEVAAFRRFCESRGYFIVSTGPREFVFIAGKQGRQEVPIVAAGPGKMVLR